MKIYFRVLLALYMIVAMAIGIFMMVMTFNNNLLEYAYNFIHEDVFSKTATSVLFFIIALIFVALNIAFLLSGILKDRTNRVVTFRSEGGDVNISLNTVETIANNIARKFSGVRDVKASAARRGETVSVMLKMIVFADVNVPSLLGDMQEKIRKNVEDTVGIKIGNIDVVIENVQAAYKGRVE